MLTCSYDLYCTPKADQRQAPIRNCISQVPTFSPFGVAFHHLDDVLPTCIEINGLRVKHPLEHNAIYGGLGGSGNGHRRKIAKFSGLLALKQDLFQVPAAGMVCGAKELPLLLG